MTAEKEPKKKKKVSSTGPGEECSCPVCVFAKSHAPGEPYDLSRCPRWNQDLKSAEPQPRRP